MPQWDAGLYLKFANERTQPSIDLIARIKLSGPARIADLGCGPGNSTEALRRRWPVAEILGLDSSPPMIDAARRASPDGTWEVADVVFWRPAAPFDLVFANAMLQWVRNHAEVCRRLFERVAPGGAFAVQVPAPAHYDSPLHRAILDVSKDPGWNACMDGPRNTFTREPASLYYDTLQPLATHIDLWETTYYHILAGPEALLEWYRGTGLRPFLEALASDDQRRRFERMVLERLIASYPRRPDGCVLFPFHRLFFVAYR